MSFSVVVHQGIMTVFSEPFDVQKAVTDNLSDFYKNLNDFNKIYDECKKTLDLSQFNNIQSAPVPNNISVPQQAPDASWFQQFIDRGRQGAQSAIHPANQDYVNNLLNSDNWSQFLFDIIKKLFGFFGIVL